MKLSIRQLEAFTTAAQAGSFSGAAQALEMTQPAFSQLVAQLEKELGFALFHRTTRKIALTVAGQALLPKAQHALRQFADVARYAEDLHTGEQGSLSIGVITSVASSLLPRALARFARQCPNIRLTFHEEPAAQLVRRVQAGDVELGWGLALPSQADLAFEPLTQDPLVVIMHKTHPLTTLQRVTWRSLKRHQVITAPRDSGVRIHTDRVTASDQDIEMNSIYQTSALSTAISLVRSNLGCAVFPRLGLQCLNLDHVVVRPLEQPSVVRDIGLLSRKGWPLSPAAGLFAEIARTVSANPRAT